MTINRKIFCISLFLLLVYNFGYSDSPHDPLDTSLQKVDNIIVSESKTVKIGSVEYKAEYGTITVLENRNKKSSRLITLPYIRVYSSSKNQLEPIFVLNGGPGGSNMRWDWGIMWYLLPEHDIVAVGYRGVDGSTVLNCPEVTQAFKGNSDLLGQESMKTIGLAWSASAKRITSEGIDLNGYTILECIEDNEAIRTAFGYDRINLISASYGTRVAYLYGLKYPEKIKRSAMICVNTPGSCVWEPDRTDKQLKYYSDLWSQDSAMSLVSKDLYADMQHVLNNMPRNWLLFSIDPGKVKVVTFALLFHRKTAAMVFDTYVAAKNGDASGLALMSLAYDYVVPSMATWGDMATKAVSVDFDSTRNYLLDMEPKGIPLGSPMSTLLWGPLSFGHWPMQLLPDEFRKPRKSDVETLLLSGSVDFANPPERATKELLPYLTNGKQVILSQCGHVNDVLNVFPDNTKLLLTSFFSTGKVDTSLNTYRPMDFNVSWGFPKLAKVGIGGIAILGTSIIAIIVRFIAK